MRSSLIIQATSLAFLLAFTTPVLSGATQIDPSLNFGITVRSADMIFAGTVSRISVEMHPSGHFPLTRVTLRNLRIAKGSSGGKDSVRITLWGGLVGQKLFERPDQPEFELGQRYVLMVSGDLGSDRTSYMPIVGMNRGLFHVIRGPKGESYVEDWECRPIVRIDRHHLVVLGNSKSTGESGRVGQRRTSEPLIEILTKADDPGTRLSEEEFLNSLRPLLE